MNASKQQRTALAPLAVSEGEKHAEFKRRRDEFDYMKVPMGAEPAYLVEGWTISKKLKRGIRLQRRKSIDRLFEDRVWRLFYRMSYDELNKGHDFTIQYKAADKGLAESEQGRADI